MLRETLDRTIGVRHDAGEIADAPVLAAVIEDSSVQQNPLITHEPFSARAEAFRRLRTNIRFLSIDHEVRSLVVTSSVANEGKSTTAANLAVAMAQSGENVALIDGDLRRPSVAGIFGLPSGVGLTSVLLGDVDLPDALQVWGNENMYISVLTAGPVPPNPSELVGSQRMAEVIGQLVEGGYTVIVDSPPLLPATDGAVLARITNGALLVTRARSTRIEQLSSAAEALRTAGATILGVLVNRMPKGAGAYYYSYNDYSPAAPKNEPPTPPPPTPMPGITTTRPNDDATGTSWDSPFPTANVTEQPAPISFGNRARRRSGGEPPITDGLNLPISLTVPPGQPGQGINPTWWGEQTRGNGFQQR